MKKFFAFLFFILIFSSCSKEEESSTIRIAAIRGPTALGLLHMMKTSDYEFELLGSPDHIPPLLTRGEVDVAVVPANLAAVLSNRTDVCALAIVTLGVLHIVETSDEIKSVADLKGRTIFLHGQGITPEIALNHVLTRNGLIPGEDVFLEFRAEHAEIAALLETGQAQVALLPEPFVSTVLARGNGLRASLDLSEEWSRVSENPLIMSVVIARREFIEKKNVANFLNEYKNSVEFVNSNLHESANFAVDFDLVPSAEIGVAAIPRSNIVFVTGEEMRRNLSDFYGVLYESNPQLVGGELPEKDFYFVP